MLYKAKILIEDINHVSEGKIYKRIAQDIADASEAKDVPTDCSVALAYGALAAAKVIKDRVDDALSKYSTKYGTVDGGTVSEEICLAVMGIDHDVTRLVMMAYDRIDELKFDSDWAEMDKKIEEILKGNKDEGGKEND